MIRFLLLLAVTVMCAFGACQDGWRDFQGYCYSFNKEQSTWITAAAYCFSVGGRLAEIDKAERNHWLAAQFYHLKIGEAFVGLNRRNMNQWVWEPSGTPVTYTSWKSGEPNGGDKEECLVLQNYGDWNDLACDVTRPFICEKKNE